MRDIWSLYLELERREGRESSTMLPKMFVKTPVYRSTQLLARHAIKYNSTPIRSPSSATFPRHSSSHADTGYSKEEIQARTEEYNRKREEFRKELGLLRKQYLQEYKFKQEEEQKAAANLAKDTKYETDISQIRYPILLQKSTYKQQRQVYDKQSEKYSRANARKMDGKKVRYSGPTKYTAVALPVVKLTDVSFLEKEQLLEDQRKRRDLRLQKRQALEVKQKEQQARRSMELTKLRSKLVEESSSWYTKKDLDNRDKILERVDQRLNVLEPLSSAFSFSLLKKSSN